MEQKFEEHGCLFESRGDCSGSDMGCIENDVIFKRLEDIDLTILKSKTCTELLYLQELVQEALSFNKDADVYKVGASIELIGSYFAEPLRIDWQRGVQGTIVGFAGANYLIDLGKYTPITPIELSKETFIVLATDKPTTPSKGDTVWVRNKQEDTWTKKIFIAEYEGSYLCKNTSYKEFSCWEYLTTEDPFVLKYELNAQEALIALANNNIITDQTGLNFRFTGTGLECKPTNGEFWCSSPFANDNNMYAIVEEEVYD
jgi:hypothetical protein